MSMRSECRLRKNEEFRHIYQNGRSVANRELVLYYIKSEDTAHFRLGISVSKKIGRAVIRNEIKRRVREVVRLQQSLITPGYDLVIIVRKGALQTTHEQLMNSFVHLLKRARLYNRSK